MVFGEGVLPGYPFWLTLTHSSEFDSRMQKEIHAHYIRNSIMVEAGELDSICELANPVPKGIVELTQSALSILVSEP